MAATTVPTYTKSGTKATTAAKLDASVFAVMPENHELLKLAYTAYLANGRGNLAQVKTRGLVRGGGKKPWKQKGTGRARFGSTRNPIWRGGGIVFGPTGEENYTKKIATNAKRQAIRQALSLAAHEGRIKVVEAIESKDGKVAPILKFLRISKEWQFVTFFQGHICFFDVGALAGGWAATFANSSLRFALHIDNVDVLDSYTELRCNCFGNKISARACGHFDDVCAAR